MSEKSDKPGWAMVPGDASRENLIRFRKLEEEVIDLKKVIDTSYIVMAEKLREIQKMFIPFHGNEEEGIKHLGYRSFQDWAFRRLEYERGKAKILAQVWAVLIEQEIVEKDDLKQMTVSKAYEVVRAANAGKMEKSKDRKRIIEVAKTGSTRDVRDAAKTAETDVPKDEQDLETFTCQVTPAQKANIMRAVETAKLLTRRDAIGTCLDLVASEFNATYPPTKKVEAAMHTLACRFEEAFDVKIIIYREDKGFLRNAEIVEEKSP